MSKSYPHLSLSNWTSDVHVELNLYYDILNLLLVNLKFYVNSNSYRKITIWRKSL